MYASLGSISTGTLAPADLTRNFIDALESFAAQDEDFDRKGHVLLAAKAARKALAEKNEAALADFTSSEAFELLDSYAPPYAWFGAHPDDGADFGFWPSIQGLQEDVRYEQGVVSVPAGEAWPELAEDIDYVMEVNDHGNVTLFDARTKKEIWSVV